MRIFLNYILFLLLLPSNAFSQTDNSKIENEIIVQLPANSDINDLKISQTKPPKLLSAEFNIWLLYIDTSKNASASILNYLNEQPNVKIAQYNHRVKIRDVEPDDTLFNQQWNLKNTGQAGGLAGADIKAYKAWDFTTGGLTALCDTIVVAVVDGGFNLDHPDLNFWKNHNEIPGNNLDDDANGYIDDFNGWNVYDTSGNLPPDYHGTHVCGIIGARGNNITGISGINWNVKILPVAGLSEKESEVVMAYSYIYTMRKMYNESGGKKGAFIVCTNSSFGVDNGQVKDFPIWCNMYNELGKLGILSVIATANLNLNVDSAGDMPTSCTSPYMISVTNSTAQDVKARFAAYGMETVDIAAPGTSILSTTPAGYGISSGTSMAAPHVAGAVALMYSYPCFSLAQDAVFIPDVTSLYIKDILLMSADPLKSMQRQSSTGGRLNIYNAMLMLNLKSCRKWGRAVTILDIYPNPAQRKINVRIYLENDEPLTLAITDIFGRQLLLQNLRLGEASNEYNVDMNIEHLKAGTYFLNTITANGSVSNVKSFIVF